MKKAKIILCGIISLIIFGLLIPQPLQAVLVLIDSPIKDYFAANALALCIAVGLIQGVCEECGYYLMFRTLLRKDDSSQTPVLFGLGRSGLELLYNAVYIFASPVSAASCAIMLVSRLFGFGGTMGLTMLDYSAYREKRPHYLILSVLLHAIMNSTLYAAEIGLIKGFGNFDAWLMIGMSVIVMLLAVLICKKSQKENIVK